MSVLERVQEQEARVSSYDGSREVQSSLAYRDQLKRELVERLGLATVAALAAAGDGLRGRIELRVACEAIAHGRDFSGLSDAERSALITQVLDEVCGLGPIQPLLDDESVTEIMINGCQSLLFERAGIIHQSDISFETADQILMVMDRILAPLGRRLDRASPW